MEFCFLRARTSIVTVGAFAFVFLGIGNVSRLAAQASSGQASSQAAGQTAGQKNWKDRAEYDLYVQITKTTDPKQRLILLKSWQDKYPQTDYQQERLQYFMVTLNQLAPTDPQARQQLLDKSNEALKVDPKNFTAMYYISLWGPAVGATSAPADLTTSVETAAHGVLDNADTQFNASKKPQQMSDPDWTKAKNQVLAIAHNALAWVATTKKDTATAEAEYKASLQANPDQGRVSAAYGKLLIDEKKYPEGLFEYARAAQYDGPEAVPAGTRPQLMDYFKKAYKDFHGAPDGSDQVLAQAKTSALPPDGFNIIGQADIANKQAAQLQERINSDPAFKLWYSIKQSLTGDQGDQFFSTNMKDAEIPGGAEGVKDFTGTVISIDPPDRPTKVVLGIEDPTKPDATLLFSQPLPASALDKIKIGSKLDFSGVADNYVKEPYMLTFKDPTVPGVQTTAPARKGTRRRSR